MAGALLFPTTAKGIDMKSPFIPEGHAQTEAWLRLPAFVLDPPLPPQMKNELIFQD